MTGEMCDKTSFLNQNDMLNQSCSTKELTARIILEIVIHCLLRYRFHKKYLYSWGLIPKYKFIVYAILYIKSPLFHFTFFAKLRHQCFRIEDFDRRLMLSCFATLRDCSVAAGPVVFTNPGCSPLIRAGHGWLRIGPWIRSSFLGFPSTPLVCTRWCLGCLPGPLPSGHRSICPSLA